MNLADHRLFHVTDLTLPALYAAGFHPEQDRVIQWCRMLQGIGVDRIELDAPALRQLGELPDGIEFSLRVRSLDELVLARYHPIQHWVIGEALLVDVELVAGHRQITLEIEFDPACPPEHWERLSALQTLDGLRLTGVNRLDALSQVRDFLAFCRNNGKNADLCPDNRYYSATAMAVEAVLSGIPAVTGSFLGYGGPHGYAALEEVLLAARVILGTETDRDLTLLPRLSRLMTGMTGLAIPDNKPVVGRNIFKYESGIHANGIQKNPATYEPFEPAWVGQTRSLTIGKHSGGSSLAAKLNELGIPFQPEDIPELVARVREASIGLGRDLRDLEIKQIGEEFYESLYCGYNAQGW